MFRSIGSGGLTEWLAEHFAPLGLGSSLGVVLQTLRPAGTDARDASLQTDCSFRTRQAPVSRLHEAKLPHYELERGANDLFENFRTSITKSGKRMSQRRMARPCGFPKRLPELMEKAVRASSHFHDRFALRPHLAPVIRHNKT